MEVGVIVVYGVDALAYRQSHLADVRGKLLLEVSVADRAVVPPLLEILDGGRLGHKRHKGKQVLYTLRHGAVGLDGTAVRQGFHHFLGDSLLIIVEIDAVALALAHLSAAVQTGHLDESSSEIKGTRLCEDLLTVHVVETAGHHPGVLQMLLLVLAHRHEVSTVNQDIGGHKHGIGQQTGTDIDALIVVVIIGDVLQAQVAGLCLGQTHLVLESSGTLQLALIGYHVEQDIKLAHLGHVALHEDCHLIRVEAGSQILGQDSPDIGMKVIRMGMGGQRMQVRYEIKAIVIVLYLHEVAQRSKVVAQMKMPGGADTA